MRRLTRAEFVWWWADLTFWAALLFFETRISVGLAILTGTAALSLLLLKWPDSRYAAWVDASEAIMGAVIVGAAVVVAAVVTILIFGLALLSVRTIMQIG